MEGTCRPVFDMYTKDALLSACRHQSSEKQSLTPHSIAQMYNEEVNDLLEPANRKLAIKEDPEEGVKVTGLITVLIGRNEGRICRGWVHLPFAW
jgi:hypothetical protein